MGGKYSAQWWEKIPDMNREIEARHSPSQVVDDLIQATATGKTRRADFASIETSRSPGLHTERWALARQSGAAFRVTPSRAGRDAGVWGADALSRKASTCRPHDVRRCAQSRLALQVLQAHWQAPAPIGMFVGRPGQIDLIL